ncbi:MAG TPA: O-antigen ligase family protein [Burkholderiales bacterium]|nr:O-antigen ligase family protein [Burkholderiales bacterium]
MQVERVRTHAAERLIRALLLPAVCAYLAFAPAWSPALSVPMYDRARAREIALLVLVALHALSAPVRDAAGRAWAASHPAARLALGAWLAVGLCSAAVSAAPKVGFQQISLLVLLAWLTFAVAGQVRTQGQAAQRLLAVACALGAGLVLAQFWATILESVASGRAFSWISPFLDFANVRFFGQYQAYALLLAPLPLLMLRLTPAWRIVAGFVASGFWMLQWLAGSRAVWVGALVAFAAAAALMGKGRLRWLAVQGGLVLAGGALYLAFGSFVLSTPGATPVPAHLSVVDRGGQSVSIRATLARAALQLTAAHPLVGTGPGQFGLHYSQTDAAHPHNAPLQLLAEYGVIGGTAAIAVGLALAIFALRELRRRTRVEPDPVAASVAAALLMGLTDALFSGNPIMPHSQVFLCVAAGWLLGHAQSAEGSAPQASTARLRMGMAGLALAAAAATTVLAVDYLGTIAGQPYPPEMRVPSFWQYGRFTDW